MNEGRPEFTFQEEWVLSQAVQTICHRLDELSIARETTELLGSLNVAVDEMKRLHERLDRGSVVIEEWRQLRSTVEHLNRKRGMFTRPLSTIPSSLGYYSEQVVGLTSATNQELGNYHKKLGKLTIELTSSYFNALELWRRSVLTKLGDRTISLDRVLEVFEFGSPSELLGWLRRQGLNDVVIVEGLVLSRDSSKDMLDPHFFYSQPLTPTERTLFTGLRVNCQLHQASKSLVQASLAGWKVCSRCSSFYCPSCQKQVDQDKCQQNKPHRVKWGSLPFSTYLALLPLLSVSSTRPPTTGEVRPFTPAELMIHRTDMAQRPPTSNAHHPSPPSPSVSIPLLGEDLERDVIQLVNQLRGVPPTEPQPFPPHLPATTSIAELRQEMLRDLRTLREMFQE